MRTVPAPVAQGGDAAHAHPAGGSGGGPARLPRSILVAVGAAWALILALEIGGFGDGLHHGELASGTLPLPVSLALFLAAWQVMVVAMMVPSSLPLIRLFDATASRQPRPGAALAALLGGYGLIWGAFGALAFVGDLLLHGVAATWPWLEARPWLPASGVLLLAGAFQFSDLKDRCLTECRHPAGFLLQHYRRGPAGAYRLGRRHGLSCLGCCWALMLVMFAAGVAALWWMAALGSLMLYEKVGRHGPRVARIAGAVFLAMGAALLLWPDHLPALFQA